MKSSNPRHRTTVKEGERWVSNLKLRQPSLATPPLPPPKEEEKEEYKSVNISHDDDNFYHNQTTFTSRTKYFAHSIESAGSIRQPDRYVATALENCTILIYWYFVTLSNFRGCNFEKVLAKSIFCPQIFDFVSSFTCSYSMQITEC